MCWGDLFEQKGGQSKQEALAESYPKLIEYRSKKYREIADIIIPVKEIKKLGIANFLNVYVATKKCNDTIGELV